MCAVLHRVRQVLAIGQKGVSLGYCSIVSEIIIPEEIHLKIYQFDILKENQIDIFYQIGLSLINQNGAKYQD